MVYSVAKDRHTATEFDVCQVLASAVRDRLTDRWLHNDIPSTMRAKGRAERLLRSYHSTSVSRHVARPVQYSPTLLEAFMRTRFCIARMLLLLAAFTVSAYGQGFQGGVRGAVRDPGGVIPGAEVTLTNEGTGIARSTTTNNVGEYNFPNVAPGTYTLAVALPGYKTYSEAGLRIGTQQFLTLDISLEVGAL